MLQEKAVRLTIGAGTGSIIERDSEGFRFVRNIEDELLPVGSRQEISVVEFGITAGRQPLAGGAHLYLAVFDEAAGGGVAEKLHGDLSSAVCLSRIHDARGDAASTIGRGHGNYGQRRKSDDEQNQDSTTPTHTLRSWSSNLLKKLRFEVDVIHKTAKSVVDVGADIEHEQAVGVDFFDAIRAAQAERKDTTAFFGKLGNPSGHFREPDGAAGLEHALFTRSRL